MPAVPEPLDRQPRVRRCREPLRDRAVTAPASTSPIGDRRQPAEPVRGPARRRRGHPDTPHRPGRALRSQDLRTSADPVTLDGSVIKINPTTGRRPGQQPERLELRPEHPPDHRPGPAQPVPVRDLARQRALDRRRRLERVGGAQPDADPAGLGGQLRLALLRGGREAERLRLGQPEHLREPLHRGRDRRPGDRPGAHLQPLRSGGPRRELLERQLLGRRGRLLRHRPVSRAPTTRRCSSPTTRAIASGSSATAPAAPPTRPR